MKNTIIILLAFLLCKTTFAQEYTEAKRVINQIIVEGDIVYKDSIDNFSKELMHKAFQYNKKDTYYKFSNDSIIYIDNTGKKTRKSNSQIKDFIVSKTFSNIVERIVVDSLTFTITEKNYINLAIDKMSYHKWDGNLIINSRVISTDTIKKAFANLGDNAWQYLEKKGINKIYTIGVPIFLRDQTYCLFYYGYDCGGGRCGSGQFAIYKREDGLWRYWTRISSWAS